MALTHALSNLTDMILEGALDQQAWFNALDGIAVTIDAKTISVAVAVPGATWTAEDWRGVEESFVRSYEDYYHNLDPITPLAWAWKPGTLFTDGSFASPQARLRSEFYVDWALPQEIHSIALANFMCEGNVVGIVGAPRAASKPYRQDQLELLSALLPTLRHSTRVRRRVASLSASDAVKSDVLSAISDGLIVVDKDAHILFANPTAESLIADTAGTGKESAWLPRLAGSSAESLRALIRKATSSDSELRSHGAIQISRPPPAGAMQVLVSPLGTHHEAVTGPSHGRVAMLMLVSSRHGGQGLEGRLTTLFGLTAAEARVAREIGQGRNPKELAAALEIMPSTVRTHLHQVFKKTGTRRQAELTRLITRISVPSTEVSS